MTRLVINSGQFPTFPDDLQVGQVVRVTVIGRVQRIEDDLVDASPLGGPLNYLPGYRTTEIAVTDWADLKRESAPSAPGEML